jgi:hypothetical protein
MIEQGDLDWIAFSIDASTDDLHTKLGRGLHKEISSSSRGGAGGSRI